jgi:hypothetical protein
MIMRASRARPWKVIIGVVLVTLLLMAVSSSSSVLAAAWTEPGGTLGSINVTISPGSVPSVHGVPVDNAPRSTYRERDWSARERFQSESTDSGPAFELIGELFRNVVDSLDRATRPLRDTIREIKENWEKKLAERQRREELKRRWKAIAALKKRDESERLSQALAVMDQWEEEVWVGPYGDCGEKQHDDLQDKVKRSCDPGIGITRKCTQNQDCESLKLNLAQNEACAAARAEINRVCYEGGDPDHVKAFEEARRGAEYCRDLIRRKCSEEARQISGVYPTWQSRPCPAYLGRQR